MMITNTSRYEREVETRSIRAPVVVMTAAERQDFLLDEALKDTFPASDPVCMPQIT